MNLIAALTTTLLPSLVGITCIAATPLVKFGVGSLLGIASFALGAAAGIFVGSPFAGGLVALFILGLAGKKRKADLTFVSKSAHGLWLSALVFGIGVLLLGFSVFRPVPAADAVDIWTLKAKAIVAFGTIKNPIFLDPQFEYSHQGYPPLFPAWQGAAYQISGDLSVGWPTQFQLAWLLMVGALAIIGLTLCWGWGAAVLAFAWVASPQIIRLILTGYADIPMALFLIVGLTVFWVGGRSVWVPSVFLAAAALTKNEGFLLSVTVMVFILVKERFRRQWILAALVALSGFLAWLVLMRVNGISGVGIRLSDVQAEASLSRIPQVFVSMVSQTLRPKDWVVLAPTAIMLLIWNRRSRPELLLPAAAFGIFFLYYLVTPTDLTWHLTTSLDRVLIAPMGLLAISVGAILGPIGAKNAPAGSLEGAAPGLLESN